MVLEPEDERELDAEKKNQASARETLRHFEGAYSEAVRRARPAPPAVPAVRRGRRGRGGKGAGHARRPIIPEGCIEQSTAKRLVPPGGTFGEVLPTTIGRAITLRIRDAPSVSPCMGSAEHASECFAICGHSIVHAMAWTRPRLHRPGCSRQVRTRCLCDAPLNLRATSATRRHTFLRSAISGACGV